MCAVDAPLAAAFGKSKCNEQFRTLNSIRKCFGYLPPLNHSGAFALDLRGRAGGEPRLSIQRFLLPGGSIWNGPKTNFRSLPSSPSERT